MPAPINRRGMRRTDGSAGTTMVSITSTNDSAIIISSTIVAPRLPFTTPESACIARIIAAGSVMRS